jgi:hypothetical protein
MTALVISTKDGVWRKTAGLGEPYQVLCLAATLGWLDLTIDPADQKKGRRAHLPDPKQNRIDAGPAEPSITADSRQPDLGVDRGSVEVQYGSLTALRCCWENVKKGGFYQ